MIIGSSETVGSDFDLMRATSVLDLANMREDGSDSGIAKIAADVLESLI